MNISSLVQDGTQARFLPEEDVPLTSNAQRRVEVGNFFEEATKVVFGARRHINQVGKYCPDLSFGSKHFLEVKAVGKSRELILFRKRLERDKEMCENEKAKLTYVCWWYNASVFTHQTRMSLRRALAQGVFLVMSLPFRNLYEQCGRQPFRLLDRHVGKPKEEAYRVGGKALRALCYGQEEYAVFSYPVFGHWLRTFSVLGPLTLTGQGS